MPYPPIPVSTMAFEYVSQLFPVLGMLANSCHSDVIDAAAPTLYRCKFGADETLRSSFGVVPTVTSDAVNNRLIITYPDHYDSSSTSTTTEILCTLQVADTDYPDELSVAAQMISNELNVGTSATYATYVLSRPGKA